MLSNENLSSKGTRISLNKMLIIWVASTFPNKKLTLTFRVVSQSTFIYIIYIYIYIIYIILIKRKMMFSKMWKNWEKSTKIGNVPFVSPRVHPLPSCPPGSTKANAQDAAPLSKGGKNQPVNQNHGRFSRLTNQPVFMKNTSEIKNQPDDKTKKDGIYSSNFADQGVQYFFEW